MNLLILEPEINGHFTSLYVRNVIKSFKKKNFNIIILTTREILQHESLNILKSENVPFSLRFMEKLKYPKKKNFYSLLRFQFKNYLIIKKVFNKILLQEKIDHVFVTNLEHFDKILGLLGSPFKNINYSGILVNPKYHQSYYDFIEKNYKLLFSKIIFKWMIKDNKLKNILINDLLFNKFVMKDFPKYKKKFHYFNEPVELQKKINKDIAKKNLNIKKNCFTILVYGALRESKCILELLDIVKRTNKKNNIKIILAGKQNLEMRRSLNAINIKKLILNKEVIMYDYFIDSYLENILFSAADSVWCVYKNTPLGSSGVFYLANLANLPLITNSDGLLGWYNKMYNLGPIIDIGKVWEPTKKLENLSLKKKYYNSFLNNRKFYKFKMSKYKNFKDILLKNIK